VKKCFYCFKVKADDEFDKPLKEWVLPVCKECEISLCPKGTSKKKRKSDLKMRLKHNTNLYIIQSILGGPIKIGVSKQVELRLKDIQRGSPFKLVAVRIIGKVPSIIERRLHKQLEEYRLHGEWFKEEALSIADQLLETILDDPKELI
jgi:hypothetical protein